MGIIEKLGEAGDEIRVSQDKKKIKPTLSKKDSPEISEKAKSQSLREASDAKEIARSLPEIREDKIREVYRKMGEGFYDNEEVLARAVENLLKFLF